jgi:gamma-glutamylcyclotransferase (GGCT)/AIG2-like uncharacterized protein YtfP
LATYGSLSPGRVNHHQLAGLNGHWSQGVVRGRLVDGGWGSAIGFPGLILDPQGLLVDVFLFESPDLPDHWARLDEFEGSGYRRITTQVETAEGEVSAWVYVLAAPTPAVHEPRP